MSPASRIAPHCYVTMQVNSTQTSTLHCGRMFRSVAIAPESCEMESVILLSFKDFHLVREIFETIAELSLFFIQNFQYFKF
jgi:hypothetical protein